MRKLIHFGLQQKRAARKRTIMQTTILFGCAVTLLVFTASLTLKERLTEHLVKVNLEPGEALLYQAEQVLEVRSGELQRGI